MKRFVKICVLGLCLAMLTACGDRNHSDETETKHITVDEQTTSESESGSAAQTGEETVAETQPETSEAETTEQIQVPEEVDSMRPLMLGLCKEMARGSTYDPSDSAFFWNGIYASINDGSWVHPDISLSDDGTGYMVPKEVMAEYANAMFSGTEILPDIPDTVGGISYDDDFGGYQLMSAESYSGTLDITNVEDTADGYTVTVAYTDRSGAVTPFTFTMTSGGSGAFACSIHNVE